MNTITEEEIRALASGFYLCEKFTEGLSDEEEIAFIKDFIWEPFQYFSEEYIQEAIGDSACSIEDFLRGKGIEVLSLEEKINAG